MPPAPIDDTISYGPSRVLGERLIDWADYKGTGGRRCPNPSPPSGDQGFGSTSGFQPASGGRVGFERRERRLLVALLLNPEDAAPVLVLGNGHAALDTDPDALTGLALA